MKTTIEWLDDVKAQHGIESDYGLAKLFGVSRQAISNYMTGKSNMDPWMAYKVAELLDIDPLKVIASGEAERARSEERRAFWRSIAASLLVGTVAGTAALPSPADARTVENSSSPDVYYVKSGRKKKQGLSDFTASALALMARTLLGPSRPASPG